MSLNLPKIKSGALATTTQYELLRVGNDPALYLPLDAASAPATIIGPLVHSRLLGRSPLIGGRLAA